MLYLYNQYKKIEILSYAYLYICLSNIRVGIGTQVIIESCSVVPVL